MNNIVILTDNGDLSNNDLSTKIQELTGLKFDSSSLFGTIKPRVEKPFCAFEDFFNGALHEHAAVFHDDNTVAPVCDVLHTV